MGTATDYAAGRMSRSCRHGRDSTWITVGAGIGDGIDALAGAVPRGVAGVPVAGAAGVLVGGGTVTLLAGQRGGRVSIETIAAAAALARVGSGSLSHAQIAEPRSRWRGAGGRRPRHPTPAVPDAGRRR